MHSTMDFEVNKRLDLKRNSMPASIEHSQNIKAQTPYNQDKPAPGCRYIVKEGKNGRRIVKKIIVRKKNQSIDGAPRANIL